MSTSMSTSPAIHAQLRDNEQVLWAKDAVHFSLLQGRDGTKVRNKMLGAVLGMGAFLGLYLAVAPEISANLILMLLVILAAMLVTPVLACRTLNDRRYVITNQRVLVFKGDWLQAEMERQAVDAVEVYDTLPDAKSLALGKPIQEEGDRQLRWRSMHPFGGDHGSYDALVLYAIPDAKGAMEVLNRAA